MIAQIDADYLRYGLARTARRLASYLLFEGRPLTTKGRFINAAVFAWLKTLSALPGDPCVDRPVFITGLGRSGTTILGILLSLHRQVGYLNEPKALWHVADPRQDINGNYSSSNGMFRLDRGDASPEITQRARRLFSRYITTTGARRVVDKYPELIFRVGYILEIFPDAKFIFLTRSGADAVPSVVRWSTQFGEFSEAHIDDWWGRNDTKWDYLREQIILSDTRYREVWSAAQRELDHTNRAALEWVVTMREGLEQQQRHPDAVVRVAYEAILTDPTGELERVQRLCGLEPDPAVADYARKRLFQNPTKGAWPKLHPAVEAIFRQTMRQLGYTVP